MVIGLWPATKLGSEFMPPLDEGDLMYMPTTYAGLSIGTASEILQQTDKLIKTVPEVNSVFGKIGRAACRQRLRLHPSNYYSGCWRVN